MSSNSTVNLVSHKGEAVFQPDSVQLRTIYINDRLTNKAAKFVSNVISTSKYNIVTFFPKFLFEQFSKYANIFFLFTACIQVKLTFTLT
jgi:phospholipid-transporting ATPase